MQAVVELFNQVGTRNQFWTGRGDEEFCEQDWGRHTWDYIPLYFSFSLKYEMDLDTYHPGATPKLLTVKNFDHGSEFFIRKKPFGGYHP